MERSLSDEIDTVIIASILHHYCIHCGQFDSHIQSYLLQRIEGFNFHYSIGAAISKLDDLLDLEWQQLYPLPLAIPCELPVAGRMSLVLSDIIITATNLRLRQPLNVIIIMERIIRPWRTLLMAIIIYFISSNLSRYEQLQLRPYFQSLFGLGP